MSQLSSTANPGSQKTHQKQRFSVYTMMLIVSFIALCLACVCLYLELEEYGKYPWWDTTDATPETTTSSLLVEPGMQVASSSPDRHLPCQVHPAYRAGPAASSI